MGRLTRFAVLLRLYASFVFCCYLAGGASLILPSPGACLRCAKENHHAGTKSGASCPLSYRRQGHDCHGSKGNSSSSIKLCPDGCLRHDEQNSEVASIAKFLSPSQSIVSVLKPTSQLPRERPHSILTRSLSPPQHPPSLLS